MRFSDRTYIMRKAPCPHGFWPQYRCLFCHPLSLSERLWLAWYRVKRRIRGHA